MSESAAATQAAARARSSLLVWIAGLILVFVVSAFAMKLVADPERLARYTPPVILHGLLMVVWFTLFLLQARLINVGEAVLHRTLGGLSVVLIVAIIGVSIPISINLGREFNSYVVLVANTISLTVFLLLYASAISAAANGAIGTHKRLMLVASTNLLGPPIGRVVDSLGFPEPAFGALLALPLTMIALPFGYDFATLGRLHRATVIAVAASLLSVVAIIAVISSPPLMALVEAWAGP